MSSHENKELRYYTVLLQRAYFVMSLIKQSETNLVCTLKGDFILCQNSYLSLAYFGHFRLKPSSETQLTIRHVKLSPENFV